MRRKAPQNWQGSINTYTHSVRATGAGIRPLQISLLNSNSAHGSFLNTSKECGRIARPFSPSTTRHVHPIQFNKKLGEHCNRCLKRKKLGFIVISPLVCVVWLLLRSVQNAAARTMGAGTSRAARAHDAVPGSRPRPNPRAMLTDRRRRHMTPDMRTSRAASRYPSQTQ